MLIGYCRVSKADGSQSTALQRDALIASGVDPEQIYEDRVSGVTTERPGLDSCLKALRGHAEGQVGAGDILVVWKLDRLGRSLKHLVQLMEDLDKRGIGLRSLTEGFDTTTPVGRLSFGVIASLAQFERDLIKERVSAGLTAARARGRLGGRPATRVAKLIAAAAAMTDPRASPREICREFKISKSTLYRYIAPDGSYREPMRKLIAKQKRTRTRRPEGGATGETHDD